LLPRADSTLDQQYTVDQQYTFDQYLAAAALSPAAQHHGTQTNTDDGSAKR
jgi:hypothetical protein